LLHVVNSMVFIGSCGESTASSDALELPPWALLLPGRPVSSDPVLRLPSTYSRQVDFCHPTHRKFKSESC
jgi:hypothetical protein